MRYATDSTIKITETSKYDVVIIGAGLAGLYTAININSKYSCCVLAKEAMDISSSWLAQGGIAAAISTDDNSELHFQDTMIAGAGLCEEESVHVLVNEGPSDIQTLQQMNVPFDLNEYGDLQITREGGHRKNRVVHAGGDATGRETVKALSYIAYQRENIVFHDNEMFTDIITDAAGMVSGALVRMEDGNYKAIYSKHVVIATGGIGQVYKTTTNPEIATGDGIAAAVRAGAVLKNMEFIQFHPTGLWSAKEESRAFLISEAVRGEGGLLKNRDGVRFMLGAHELSELAPRDIVARAIFHEMHRTGDDHVFVDITFEDEEHLRRRFPTIYSECLSRGINISKDMIPVCPVQHYMIGGIQTDLFAQTNVPGLYACGEAAYTGVHGANRLASNSMLECLVFGRRAAEAISRSLDEDPSLPDSAVPRPSPRPAITLDYPGIRKRIQTLMYEYGFVVRNREGMEYAEDEVCEILALLSGGFDNSKDYFETLNIATIAASILAAALERRESIGAHYREN